MIRITKFLVFASVTILAFHPLSAQEEAVPSSGFSALDDVRESLFVYNTDYEIVPVEGKPFDWVIHLSSDRQYDWPWEVGMIIPLNRPVEEGQAALARFHARAIRGIGESDEAYILYFSQLSRAPHTKAVMREFRVGHEWREFYVPYTFNESHAEGDHAINFGIAFGDQELQIAGIELLYFEEPVDLESLPRTERSYIGQASDAPWRDEALQRISEIRQGNFTIRLVDESGVKIENATVDIELSRHAFPFGTAVSVRRLMEDSPDGEKYREVLLENFNSGGPENALKWPPWVGGWGENFNQEQTLSALEWMNENFIRVRGHTLVWPSWRHTPWQIGNLYESGRQAEIPDAVLAHIQDIMTKTDGLISDWDVVNEPYANHDLMDLFGEEIMVDWFKAAHEQNPDVGLFLNDYGILSGGGRWGRKQDEFVRTARFLLDNGAPITGLGLQSHMGDNVTPPHRVLEILDSIAELGLTIHITEFDVASDDQQYQADYLRDFYIAAFSHPAVEMIQMWGFWEGQIWEPNAALFRQDWTPKPNALEYQKLLNETFHTSLTSTSDESGTVTGRGFYGDYEVRISTRDGVRKGQFTLIEGETEYEIVMD